MSKSTFFLVCVCLGMPGVSNAEEPQAAKLLKEGNYQEALKSAQKTLRSDSQSPKQLVDTYQIALHCFQKLNRINEIDAFREELTTKHSKQPLVLAAVAESWLQGRHHGYQIAGEFRRGNHRGGGKVMNAMARDRVRALQIYWQAYQVLKLQSNQKSANDLARLLDRMSTAVMHGSNHHQAWRLQSLTDLTDLLDYEEGWGYHHGQPQGAPVDTEGNPVFYGIPDSWKTAKNDGQRWRWLLEEAARLNPEMRQRLRLRRAEFLQSQFGVQNLARINTGFGFNTFVPPGQAAEAGTFALHTLGENETIAKLATGIKRFELPDDQNHIKLFRQVEAPERLAALFENRRQYPKAAESWQKALEQNPRRSHAQNRLDQIVNNWGRFEPVMAQPAGQGATVDFRFRNGKRVEFTAQRIDAAKLLADVKAFLSENPRKLDWDQLQLENLGHRLVTRGQKKYLNEEVARWSLDLEPREGHFDRRITVTTPLQKSGAYLLTSKMADGNTTSVVLWLNDTAIVKKPLDEKSLYYVADAVTGQPVTKCNVEFFGYWQENLDGNKFQIHTKNLAELTDENGLVELPAVEANRRYQWVAIATTESGRFAYLGFRNVWSGNYDEQNYQQVKVFTITDRPVYRPAQKVQFKFWVRHARYDQKEESKDKDPSYAGQSFQIEVRDPKNEKVFTTQIIADAYGGLEGEWEIPAGSTLGQYRINVVNHGGGSFRVEEYKKPEFEVTIDAPSKPVKLGEKITAKISAKYYFGSPVTSGKVKYKILRTNYQQAWYPPMPWDWLYGSGYGWFAENYRWYPGWARWGCGGPSPWWFWRAPTPPEVVAEQEVTLGPDGTLEIEIDTSAAKQFHPDQDHSYQIQAEVVDESRRTIVGNGRVLVAREPFKVHIWVDRGYYKVGDTIAVGTAARTLDAKPVNGEGTLRLLKIQYENEKPVETEVGSWPMPSGEKGSSDETGQAKLQIKASEPGQYRLSYELTDVEGHTIEGGQVLTVTGEGFDGSQFRFNDLEIVPDKREYQAGDKVALQINTNRTGAAVLLFLRPSGGVYLPPQLVRLDGKSKIVEFEITQGDMPNFFIEAVTVHGGKSHVVTRELFVPPVKRVLNVEVAPSAEAYLPGQAAKFLVKLTDEKGEPFVGSLALSIYDKAVEYIAGGTNVADIREFFWKWRRRSHQTQGETNLQRSSHALVEQDKPTMQHLGVFGAEVANHTDARMNYFSMGFGVTNGADDTRVKSRSRVEKSAPMAAMAMEADEGLINGLLEEASPEENLVKPTVRQNFADTALWIGSLETNAEGIAEVELDMPENLTTWKVRAWGMGHGTRVGEGTAEVVTRKNLIVRLQAPRFFVERDEVVLSANVHNYLDKAKQVRVQLTLAGKTLTGPKQLEKIVEIEAGGEQRVDWRVRAASQGETTIKVSALTDEESDAMQMTFPVYVHGMLKTESFTGVVRPEEIVQQFTITIPDERRAEQTRLEVRYTPTLAGAMVDALPYLIDYPYGCTEQTLNRFLPAVITQQTLRKMNVDLAAVQKKRTNLNAQEIDDDIERAKDWQRFDNNPVFDEAELSKIVKAGVNRLTEMQLSDGGWGWFSGWGERSSPHTTAVVVRGLLVAKANGVAIVPDVLDRGISWLQAYQAQQVRRLKNWEKTDADGKQVVPYKQQADNLDALVYMVLAEAERDNKPMQEYLYRDRTHLAIYALALYGNALHHHADTKKLTMVMRNLSQYVRQDDENQTAWLEMPSSGWWHWYGSEYEAHAYYLKLLAETEPKSEVAPRLVKYLLNNRKHATYWNSTRDTALVVEAFADYLAASGEDDPEVTVEIWIDGQQRKQVAINRDNLFTFDNKLVLTGDALSAGRHTVEIRKQGQKQNSTPIYFNGYLTNFTLEDDIRAAGLELKVERRYFKLTPAKKTTDVAGGRGQVVNQKVEKYDRHPLVNLAELTSGDLVEVELIITSKNDYEYLLLEDMKAAGFEPVEIRSGYGRNELGAYMELRDDRVSLFVSRLARGRHSVSYRLRAEIPGKFSALPTRVSAMYAPELKANSDEMKLRIAD